MPGYPLVNTDTVLYEQKDIYADKDINLTVLDSSKLNIWGQAYLNGIPITTLVAGFDVRAFGAKGDGVTDDSGAIQAAITAANGGTVFFSKGTYKVGNSGLTLFGWITAAGTTLLGESVSDTIILFTPTTTAFREGIRIAADDVTIQNLTIRRASSYDSIMFPMTAGVDRFTLRDCILDGGDDVFPVGYTHGVGIAESGFYTRLRFERCRFMNFHEALLQTNTSTATITDIQYRDCEFSRWVGEALSFNCPVGVNRDVIVDGCRFVEQISGLNALSLAHVENARITNNYFNVTQRESIHIEDYSRDVVIANNTFYECGGVGSVIEIMDSAYITVDSNTIRTSTLLASNRIIEVLSLNSGTTVGGRPVLNATYAVTISNNTIYAGPNNGIVLIHCGQVAVVGNTIIGDLAINSSFVETGTNAYSGITLFYSTQLGARISDNMIRGFRMGVGQALNAGSLQPGTVLSNNSVAECRYGIIANNTKSATFTGNHVNRCIWPFSAMPAFPNLVGNEPHTIVGNVFNGNQYPAAFDGVIPVVANGTASIGSGVTLVVQPLVADIHNLGVTIRFPGGGVFVTTVGSSATGVTTITGNLTVANIAAGEVGIITGAVDVPYTTPFTARQHSAYANVDSNRDINTVTKQGFYTTAPVAKPAVTGAKGSNVALGSLLTQLVALGLVTDSSTA